MRTRGAPKSGRYVSRLTRGTLALVLAGGRGARLEHLTLWRAKPATPFGGKFRIIDFPLSNCVNSGIRKISVLTQYKAHSLIQHIRRGWGYLRGEFGEFVELLPAQQQLGEMWYRGTADAVYQNLSIIREHRPKHVVILAGDHIYKMDYGPMVAFHVEQNADITVGVVEVPRERAREFGVLTAAEDNRVIEFNEKPEHPKPVPGRENIALASMGIYVFDLGFLDAVLRADATNDSSHHDFGKDIVPNSIHERRVFAYPFQDVKTRAQSYWRDVGNVDAYFEANMELVHVKPELNIYDRRWPIWTYQEQLPPAKFVLDDVDRVGMAVNSMVSGGCIISGARVSNSLLFSNVSVHERSVLRHAVVLPSVRIGKDCRVTNAVIDEHCELADGMVIGENPVEDAAKYHVTRKGVVLVTPDMLGQHTQEI